ncbi:hypothetical protein N752_29255 [Desulforamulus aquiferis]|nr:hypothetical protein N752_29255 [Desulforamulus aquiferis]
MPAKNVLQKYWNGTDWVELHPVTKASNVIMSDHISVQDKLDTHLADGVQHKIVDSSNGSKYMWKIENGQLFIEEVG